MTAVQRDYVFVKRNGSNSERKKTTRGWQPLFECLDRTMMWEKLSNLKESYPIQVAKYARVNGIINEPTFAWWARYILKERRAIILKVKTKYWSRTHKYGVRVPKSIAEARRLDKENRNMIWQDALDKEMTNNAIVFDIRHH